MVSCLDCCFRTARWFPVVFIWAVIVWSYYAYVVELLVKTIPRENMAEKVILGILYHPILLLFGWAYYQIVYTSPKPPPMSFYLDDEQLTKLHEAERSGDREKGAQLLEEYVQNLPVLTRTYNQSVRYCEKCKCIKPDRAHHCSVCKMCVTKMDHHCPWVNNCVSYINYKFFILFLLYAEIYCLYIALSDLKYFIGFWQSDGFLRSIITPHFIPPPAVLPTTTTTYNRTTDTLYLTTPPHTGISSPSDRMNFHVLFLFIVSVMFSLSVMGLLGYHLYLVLKNQTTLESFRPPIFKNSGPDKNGFNLGKSNNWREVFGDNNRLWFLPLITCKGDGVAYPTRFDVRAQSYNTMEEGQASAVDMSSNETKKDSSTASTTSAPTQSSQQTSGVMTSGSSTANHIEAEEDEDELSIYTDDDESAGDLSDDEPPITEQDISGRPQSQFKLRVTSAMGQHNHTSEASGLTVAHEPYFLDELNEEQLERLSSLNLNEQDSKSTNKQQQTLTSHSKSQQNEQTHKSNKTPDSSKIK